MFLLRYANTKESLILSGQETSAWPDSTQWNVTGKLGRKQMMSHRGHEPGFEPVVTATHGVPLQPANPARPIALL